MKKCKIRLTDNSKKLISMLEIDDVKGMIQLWDVLKIQHGAIMM